MVHPRLLLLAACVLVAGCTVGPDYAGPPSTTAGRAAAFARGRDLATAAAPPAARWWQALGDPLLDRMEDRALAANPDLAIATARLRQARAGLRADRAAGGPSVSATALYAHARLPGLDLQQAERGEASGGGGDTTSLDLYNLGFDASWEVDLFGGQRRRLEAARATVAAAADDIADAQVSLSAEVAQAYVNLRDRQQRIRLSNEAVDRQQRMLALTRQRADAGTASALDVVRLQADLDNTRADLVPLSAELESYLDELATLTGEAPGALDPLLTPVVGVPLPPAAVAIGDPAALLRRRPDIRAAERRLAADTARIGLAQAAQFPRLSLMGIVGIGGTSASDLTRLDDLAVLAAPQLSWSFLDFGRNRARIEQAGGARDESEARYRAAVLAGLRDAESALSRFRYRRNTVATLARALGSAEQASALSDQRYRAGTTTLTDVLDAQRRAIAARQSLSVAEAGLTGDFIALQKSLGLGWGQPAAN